MNSETPPKPEDADLSNSSNLQESELQSSNTQPALPDKKRLSGKKIFLATLTVLLLLGSAVAAWYIAYIPTQKEANQVTTEKTTQKSLFSRILVTYDVQSVNVFDIQTSKFEKIYETNSEETAAFCMDAGCGDRRLSISPDYSKIAFDHVLKNGKEAIGIYDRGTKKTTVLTNGNNPFWSPDGTKLAYIDDSGVNAITTSTGDRITIDNSKPTINEQYRVAFPLTIIGWKSNNEIVFDDSRSPDDTTFNIGNTKTKANAVITIQGLAAEESMREAVLSTDGSKMLIQIDKDPGYDTATINTDGSGLARVSGNTSARWPGSGYGIGSFSPDNQTVVITNNFISANPVASNRSSGEYEIHNLQGQLLNTVSGYRTMSDTQPCWYDENHIYALFTAEDRVEPFLAVYDKSTNKVTKLSQSNQDIGSVLACAQ